jgi:hypothetical protein
LDANSYTDQANLSFHVTAISEEQLLRSAVHRHVSGTKAAR